MNSKRYFPSNYNDYAHLWFDYFHELIGFIISEDFDHFFFIFLKDEYSHLYSEMIKWYKNKWKNHYDSFMTQVVENQVSYQRILEKHGFIKGDTLEKRRVFDTRLYKDYHIPDHSVPFQSMKENGNYDNQAELRLNAWPKDHDKELDKQIRRYIRKSPLYNPHFDFVFVNKKGKHVSGCEAFIDYHNNTAEIERVCTHSDYYNKGYAQMALKACMNRLYHHNIRTAYLSGGYDKTIHLYGKLGHTNEVNRYFYQLKGQE